MRRPLGGMLREQTWSSRAVTHKTALLRHLTAALVGLALCGLPATVTANGLSQPSLLIEAPLRCRHGLCSDSLGYAPPDTRRSDSAPSLHFVRGAWRLAWSSGFALHYAFLPMFTRANITYAPDFNFRSHSVRVSATFYFF
jgi:hypothetical protein